MDLSIYSWIPGVHKLAQLLGLLPGLRYKVHHHRGRPGPEVLTEKHRLERRQRAGSPRHHHRPLRARPHVLHKGEQQLSLSVTFISKAESR